MKRFELIGPSGVGKTTLYNSICRTERNWRNYLTVKEAYVLAAGNAELPLTAVRLRLYRHLLKQNILNNRELGLARHVLQLNRRKNKLVNRSDYERFSTSFKILYNDLGYESNPIVVAANINAFIKRIDEYLILNRLLTGDHRVLFDDGMIHLWGGLGNYDTSTISPEDIKNDVLFNPAGVILCEHAPEVIYNQVMKRKNEGVFRFSLDHYSQGELISHINADVENLKIKAGFFKDHNIPVLTLDLSEDVALIMQKINCFVAGV
ncbi:MAG: hypothetical protein ACNA8K_16975 [Cyclonatronaceae bacterium]